MSQLPGSNAARSAALEVYSIPELRAKIIGLLGRAELVSFMRVRQACVEDVAKRLYEEVKFDLVYYGMKYESPRVQFYLDAIREIKAEFMTISDEMLAQLGPPSTPPSFYRPEPAMIYRYNYEAKLFNLVIPYLRSKCRNLQEVHFGAEYGDTTEPYHTTTDPSWVVRFNPPSPTQSHIGSITHIQCYVFHLGEHDPPSDFTFAPHPPSGYTVEHWVDVWLHPTQWYTPPDEADGWIKAIREGPFFGRVWGAVNFINLPLTLNDFESLYRRQAGSGCPHRLDCVASTNTVYDINDFRRFASVASSMITNLQLGSSHSPMEGYDPDRTKLHFSDLASLVSVVQTDLPNLRAFAFSMRGIEEAEEICRELLDPHCLDDGGVLTQLLLYVDKEARTPMFNTLRYLSRIITSDCPIRIERNGDRHWSEKKQQDLHRYLRSQPAHRKAFLSTVDFSTLGIVNPSQVLELTYHPDGRPRRIAEQKAEERTPLLLLSRSQRSRRLVRRRSW